MRDGRGIKSKRALLSGDVKTRIAGISRLEGYRQGESLTHLTAFGKKVNLIRGSVGCLLLVGKSFSCTRGDGSITAELTDKGVHFFLYTRGWLPQTLFR